MRTLLLLCYFGLSLLSSHASPSQVSAGQSFWLYLTGLPSGNEANTAGAYRVSDQGTVRLPGLQSPLNAQNLTVEQLQTSIEQSYLASPTFEIYEPHAHVELLPLQRQTNVSIGGEVVRPDQITFRQGLDFLGAIEQCGGPTQFTDLSRVILFRETASTAFDLRKINRATSPLLKAGDHLWVLETGFYPTPTPEPKLSVGSEFSIRISGVPQNDMIEISGNYKVSAAGTIKLPRLEQPLKANGLTFSEFQKQAEQAYRKAEIFEHPTILLPQICLMRDPNLLMIGGEVKNPGDYHPGRGLTLRSLLAKSGGVTAYADLRRVKLVRGKTETIHDLRAGSKENPLLQAGDQIVLPGR